jgi:hypothetical protein
MGRLPADKGRCYYSLAGVATGQQNLLYSLAGVATGQQAM